MTTSLGLARVNVKNASLPVGDALHMLLGSPSLVALPSAVNGTSVPSLTSLLSHGRPTATTSTPGTSLVIALRLPVNVTGSPIVTGWAFVVVGRSLVLPSGVAG